MVTSRDDAGQDAISAGLYDVDSSDPRSELIDRSAIPAEDVMQINKLMKALSQLREAEMAVSDASQRYMKLSALDMRALHYLIVAQNQGVTVTPGILATHLHISAASTTKLLNRLEAGAHIVRRVNPSDRRAFAIEVTKETERSANETVGRHQSRRFYSAARLTPAEREIIIRFLDDMTAELSLSTATWANGSQS